MRHCWHAPAAKPRWLLPHTCDSKGHLLVNPPSVTGRGVLRCRAPVRRSQLARKLRPQAGSGGDAAAAAPPVQCACPGCGTTRVQRCLNCLGEGRVCLPS